MYLSGVLIYVQFLLTILHIKIYHQTNIFMSLIIKSPDSELFRTFLEPF